MEPVAFSNSQGFTLVEFLISIVILTVVLLALLESVTLSIAHNMKNQLRNQAILIADEKMNREKLKPFDAISSGTTKNSTDSYTIGLAHKNYSSTKTISATSNSSKSIDINVSWHYKGQRHTHSIISLVAQ